MQQLGFFQRLRLVLGLIWSLLIHPAPPAERLPPETATNRARWAGEPGTTPPRPQQPPPLGDLVRVIPIAQTRSASGIDITLFSLIIFEGGFIVHGMHSLKCGEIGRDNIWHAHPAFTVADDRSNANLMRGGRTNDSRFEFQFFPALDTNARELTITISEMRTTFFKEHRHEVDEGPWVFSVALT